MWSPCFCFLSYWNSHFRSRFLQKVDNDDDTPTYICGFKLKALLFGVHNRMFLNVSARSRYPDDLQEKDTNQVRQLNLANKWVVRTLTTWSPDSLNISHNNKNNNNVGFHLLCLPATIALVPAFPSIKSVQIIYIQRRTEAVNQRSKHTQWSFQRSGRPGGVHLEKADYQSKDRSSWNISLISLTDLAMAGSPHSVLSSLVLCNRPSVSTLLCRTSTPNTPGFMGLGYFCIAALVTVSHGWLSKTIWTFRKFLKVI